MADGTWPWGHSHVVASPAPLRSDANYSFNFRTGVQRSLILRIRNFNHRHTSCSFVPFPLPFSSSTAPGEPRWPWRFCSRNVEASIQNKANPIVGHVMMQMADVEPFKPSAIPTKWKVGSGNEGRARARARIGARARVG